MESKWWLPGAGGEIFMAALVTIAKIWKQPKSPLKDEWISKMGFIHTVEY